VTRPPTDENRTKLELGDVQREIAAILRRLRLAHREPTTDERAKLADLRERAARIRRGADS